MMSWISAFAGVVLTGCGLGVGPYQPRRDPYATAGGARPGFAFDEASRRAAHQQAKRETVPEIGGGTTAMYAFDGAYYVGVMQGAGRTREGDGDWGTTRFFMQVHAGFFQTILDDRLTLGVSALAAGYGSGNQSDGPVASYRAAGGELSAKVGLTRSLGLRLGAGLLYGSAEHDDDMAMVQDDAMVAGWRAAGGFDWVFGRLRGNDLVLTIEFHDVRTGRAMLAGTPTHVEARGLGFELVLVGI
jgi:hypothetical protein